MDGAIIERFGASSARGAANRFYFLLDEDGTIIWKDTTGRLLPIEVLLSQLTEAAGG